MTDDIEFETLMDMANDVLQRAGRSFDDGDRGSDRYAAFLHACFMEAARRAVVRKMSEPENFFAACVSFFRAAGTDEGQRRPPLPFAVIDGGKE